MFKTRQHPKKEVPEEQFFNWIWRAAGLPAKGKPLKRADFTPEFWDMLDDSRPLAISWRLAVLTQEALHVRRDLWALNRKSPIVDVMDSAASSGAAIVSEIELPGPKGLMVLYVGTPENDIDVFDIDTDCNNCVIIPSWSVSCENVIIQANGNDEEEMV